jgi:hypothetical protein
MPARKTDMLWYTLVIPKGKRVQTDCGRVIPTGEPLPYRRSRDQVIASVGLASVGACWVDPSIIKDEWIQRIDQSSIDRPILKEEAIQNGWNPSRSTFHNRNFK